MEIRNSRGDTESAKYGSGDATFIAMGGEQAISNLVDCFYATMGAFPKYKTIYDWHPDKALARDKLTRFLCGWTGGPKLYSSKYGPVNLPAAHAHLSITVIERDLWLHCMQQALDEQDYSQCLKEYLMEQFFRPAEMIRSRCED